MTVCVSDVCARECMEITVESTRREIERDQVENERTLERRERKRVCAHVCV